MPQLAINQIPAGLLRRFNSTQIVLITTADLGEKVLGATTLDPYDLHEIEGLQELTTLRRDEGVYSITLVILELTEDYVEQATIAFENRFRIIAELDALLRHYQQVFVAYTVTHFNYKPCDELTIFIGGDCYRTDNEIKDLQAILSRTRDLAQAMIRKAVMIFPDIPTLHGGKKGEWIVLDKDGKKIEGISEETIVALGTLIIPKGIKFLNDYKEISAIKKDIFVSFPEKNFIRPDTASPDVLSGPNWKTMCEVWAKRGLDLSYVTCLPEGLGGPRFPSSLPTGNGVVATAIKLVEYYFKGKRLQDIRFLLEAVGGVGQATVKGLLDKGGKPENITAFDKSAEACKRVSDKYKINTLALTHDEFYRRLEASQRYDAWINNGEGDNTRPEYIDKLLQSGIKIFCGAANNFLKRTDNDNDPHDESLKQQSLQKIFDAGAWVWPDEAASGGGWTMAVLDVLTRSKGHESNTLTVGRQIFDTIVSRNERLVDDVVGGLAENGQATGEAIWKKVGQIIDERVKNTLIKDLSGREIFERADVRKWKLA